MQIICDSCHRRIVAAPIERREDDGGLLVVLPCRVCEAEFPIVRMTARGIALRNELNKARRYLELVRKYGPHEAVNRTLKRTQKLEKAFQRECTKVSLPPQPLTTRDT